MDALTAKRFSFEDFELDGERRVLLKQGQPVALNSKTLDLLLALVERRGEVLSKDDLLEKVWPGQFVEEGNLSVHISGLRKALGEKKKDHNFIVTVPGRGYSFIAELRNDDAIVVESHRLSRVLVEEEISENEPVHETPKEIEAAEAQLSWFDQLKRRRLVVAASIFIIAAITVGGYILERSRTSKSSVPFQQMSMRRLTNIGNAMTATIAPDGKLFAYTVQEGEQQSLWVGHVDGGEPVQIRPAAHVIYLGIKFTPDGSSIYYTTSENFAPGTLYRIPVFGGAPEKIRDNFRTLTFSPDGKQFAFVRFDEKQNKSVLFAADSKDGSEHELAVPPSEVAVDWHSPAWSPDGLSIALAARVGAGEATIFAMNVADGSVTRLASRTWADVRSMTWLPGGKGLVAVAIDNNAVYWQLWHISFPNGEVRRLTTDLNFYGLVAASSDGALLSTEGKNQSNVWVAPAADLSASKQITFGSPGQDDGWAGIVWTNDGRIVYTADTDAGTNIWIMDSDGKNRKQIIPNGGINNDPGVTADAQYLVFQSNRGGHWAVWRSDLDGGNLVQLTSEEAAGEPSVSPDGRWIVYETSYDGAGELWRMSIGGGDAVKLSNKTAEWPQISPDSKFVACGLYMDGEVKLAILPIEGGEPLKTFSLPRLFNFRWSVRWAPDGKAVTYRDWANGIWKQNLEGGEPQRLEGLPEEKLAAYGWSRDGKQLAFTRLVIPRDVVLIEDLSK
jgi:Tol biopolymer transport system component/DNA-binding winged helix-turn-helix (wHTH) protein